MNGELNFAIDNTVKYNQTVPGGIAVSSSLSMYGSYALSNVVVANSAGVLTFSGDGGCANYASENVIDVSAPGSAVSKLNLWFKTPLNASDCIEGAGTTASQIVRDVGLPVALVPRGGLGYGGLGAVLP